MNTSNEDLSTLMTHPAPFFAPQIILGATPHVYSPNYPEVLRSQRDAKQPSLGARARSNEQIRLSNAK